MTLESIFTSTKSMKTLFLFLFIVVSSIILNATDQQSLKISDSKGKQLNLSPKDLLSRTDCEDIVIPKGIDPAHPDIECIIGQLKSAIYLLV